MSSSPIDLSFIIPVYNVAQYLPPCLNSLLSSTSHLKTEIILINDGSTDDSLAIIQAFIQNHPQQLFQIKSQKHQNAGVARNQGLSLARGEFVVFVDPDDWLDSVQLEKALAFTQKKRADVSLCFAQKIIPQTKQSILLDFPYPFWARPWVISFRLGHSFLFRGLIAPWNKIYRTSFLRQNHLSFQSLSSANDVAFYFQMIASAQRVAYYPHAFYYYRAARAGSSSQALDRNYPNLLLSRTEAITRLKKLPTQFGYAKYDLLARIIADFLHPLPNFSNDHSRQHYLRLLTEFAHQISQDPDFSISELHRFSWWTNFLQAIAQ